MMDMIDVSPTWLASLQAGDKVAVRKADGDGYHLLPVLRVTPTQIIVASAGRERRCNRSTGRIFNEPLFRSIHPIPMESQS